MRFALVGHPVGHSMSPPMHLAAYGALRLEHAYELIDCPTEEDVRRVIEQLKTGELGGVNVTVPHKRLAVALADGATTDARSLGAANVWVRNSAGAVEAHNTDVPALAAELSRFATRPIDVASVIGSGGAALAAVAACFRAGARQVNVVARGFQEGLPVERWNRATEFERLGARPVAWPRSPSQLGAWGEWVRASQVLVQATTAGMLHSDSGEAVSSIVPWPSLQREVLAYDLVYNPTVTPFLAAAAERGLRAEGGLGMLVEQAALSIKLWLGVEAPRDRMQSAALERLSRGS